MDWDNLGDEIEDFDFEFDVEKIKEMAVTMAAGQKVASHRKKSTNLNPEIAQLEDNLDNILLDLQGELAAIVDMGGLEKKVLDEDGNEIVEEPPAPPDDSEIVYQQRAEETTAEAVALFEQLMAGGGGGAVDTAKRDAPICPHCNQAITGTCLYALNKKWHSDHFLCAHCYKPFHNRPFFVHHARPYCERDFQELFGFRCGQCLQPITETCVSACGQKWHPEHFECSQCANKLRGQVYYEIDGRALCEDCEEERLIALGDDDSESVKVCTRCGNLIYGEFVQFGEQFLCPEHLVCATCGVFLQGGKCFEYSGDFYCEDDYKDMIRSCCAYCYQPIEGRVISCCNKNYHIEHFRCTHCEVLMSETKYFAKNDKPYCDACYHSMWGRPCARCGKVIKGRSLDACGKLWHQSCFKCVGCEQSLAGRPYSEYDGKPICRGCLAKLPRELRKRAEREKVKREKEERKEKALEAQEEASTKKPGISSDEQRLKDMFDA